MGPCARSDGANNGTGLAGGLGPAGPEAVLGSCGSADYGSAFALGSENETSESYGSGSCGPASGPPSLGFGLSG